MPHYFLTLARSRLVIPVMAILALCGQPAQAQEGPQPRLSQVQLSAGMHVIHAEVARTDDQQMRGLMFRRELNGNDGMLFVNERSDRRCFWMRNTLVALTIAFVDDDGSIVNLADMPPQSDQSHCSSKPVRFALEMPLGWFAKRGIKAGAKLGGAPFKP